MNQHQRRIIELSLKAGALAIRTNPPFLWASGARMPIYNDNRRLMALPEARMAVRDAFLEMVREHRIEGDAVAGTASAGIAPATVLAEAMGLPLYYVRTAAKDHGRENLVEGATAAELNGKRVILVEDLISTGGSSAAAAEALLAEGASVSACLAIFSYGLPQAESRFAAISGALRVLPVCTVDMLLQEAMEQGRIASSEVDYIRRWVAGGEVPVARDAEAPAVVGKMRDPRGTAGAATDDHHNPDRDTAASISPAVPSDEISLLCVGLDPRPELIPGDDVGSFLKGVIDTIAATGVTPGAFKPNIAYFHQLDRPLYGDFRGSRALAETILHIRTLFPTVPIILDAKRGDIADTSEAYGREAFTSWQADAVTASPYMGDDSVAPLLQAAATEPAGTAGSAAPAGSRKTGQMRHRCVYLLNRTSNPGAQRFQSAPVGDKPMYRAVAEAIAEWQRQYGSAGAVIGATSSAELEELLSFHLTVPVPVLIPGVGAQGATVADVRAIVDRVAYPPELVRINVSRDVVFPWARDGAIPTNWRAAVRTRFLRLAEETTWTR
ncbi:MAG: orotidine 5'-phosphate decarboxylase / HUMPS family protein [Alkalispirochaeta sp.]